MVEQVGGNFTNGGLARNDPGAEGAAAERAAEVSWVIWSKLLLVNWLEDGDRLSSVTAQHIAATSTVISKFGAVALLKSHFNLSDLL